MQSCYICDLFWDFCGSRLPIGPKKSRFSGSTPSNGLGNGLAPSKSLSQVPYEKTGKLVILCTWVSVFSPRCCQKGRSREREEVNNIESLCFTRDQIFKIVLACFYQHNHNNFRSYLKSNTQNIFCLFLPVCKLGCGMQSGGSGC